ncbi:MAG: GNAT family N-acetyltransferase [Nocardioides sp.]|uniref:GNAT family N-acetyltransferase n=1 Tax=Nocardioides sp. TaxID=35761 RepID=UPI003F090330
MTTVVRETTAADGELLRDVRLRALADSPDSFGSTLARERAFGTAEWESRAGSAFPTLLALRDDVAVAMGGVYVPEGEEPQVWGMWTDPAHRGHGTGAAILDRLLAWCARRSRSAVLHVTVGNDAARALYVSRGFEPSGVVLPLRPGSDLVVEELRWEPAG